MNDPQLREALRPDPPVVPEDGFDSKAVTIPAGVQLAAKPVSFWNNLTAFAIEDPFGEALSVPLTGANYQPVVAQPVVDERSSVAQQTSIVRPSLELTKQIERLHEGRHLRIRKRLFSGQQYHTNETSEQEGELADEQDDL